VLVPTTLLAEQHEQNFRDRFADWPVRIEALSRFRSAKEQKTILADLTGGKVDIVIGTHRLLQGDVAFANIGLVIIDEEHRFGVRHKERTATPIPRTLNLSLSGLRDLSLIMTPPNERLAIKTFVNRWDPALIAEAIQRELKRGGQVYFLHNHVETIDKTASEIEKIVPGTSVRVAHGQMPERELEQVMLDFYHRRFQVLVCTTIIESGIDVHRRAERQHHRHRPRRPSRPRPAAPAARSRGPLAPPRLRLPRRARAQGDDRRCHQATRGDRLARGARRRLPARHPRSRPPTISRSAVPASCSARIRAGRSNRSVSRSTWRCSSAPCGR
jgi:hypothetical protein